MFTNTFTNAILGNVEHVEANTLVADAGDKALELWPWWQIGGSSDVVGDSRGRCNIALVAAQMQKQRVTCW
jgi:hypothetical protein